MTEKEKEALQTFIIEAIDANLHYAYCDNCRFSGRSTTAYTLFALQAGLRND